MTRGSKLCSRVTPPRAAPRCSCEPLTQAHRAHPRVDLSDRKADILSIDLTSSRAPPQAFRTRAFVCKLWTYAKDLLERYDGGEPPAWTEPTQAAFVRELAAVACYLRRRHSFADRNVKNPAAVLEGIEKLRKRLEARRHHGQRPCAMEGVVG